MSVKVQSTIEPYNDSYKVVNAKNVGVGEGDNEKPLDEVLENLPSGGGTGGGVSSWNDLTDKPFGENEDGTVTQLDNKYLSILEQQMGVKEWLPNTAGYGVYMESLGAYRVAVQTTEETYLAWIENTEPFVVIYDGVEYLCNVHELDGTKYIGNAASFGGIGNGEPFAILIMPDSRPEWHWWIMSTVDTAATEHTVRIYQNTPEKYVLKNEHLAILDCKVESAKEFFPSATMPTVYESSFGAYICQDNNIITTQDIYDAWQANTDTITVIYDGVEYVCEVQETAEFGKIVGDFTIFGGTGNKEPFVIGIIFEDNIDYIWIIASTVDSVSTEHTVEVYQGTSKKYVLKEECLPFDAIAAYIDSYIDEALGGDY